MLILHVDSLTCIICQSLLENFAQISSPHDASLALWFQSFNQTTHNVQPFFLSIHNQTSHYK